MLKRGLLAIGVVAMVGCGSADNLDEADSERAWEATQNALGGHDARPNALSVSEPCDGGGSVKWKFNLTDNFGLGAYDDSFNLEYHLKFKNCQTDDVKISGRLTYTISSKTTGTTTRMEWGYNGNLRFRGEVNGSCDVSMVGTMETSETSGSLTYSGSFCGNDAGSMSFNY